MRRLFLLLSGLSAACAHPAIRDLSVPPPQAPRPSRGCVLSVGSVTDERPTIEREGGKQTSLTFLFPLPWIWIQRSAGFRLHSVDTIGGERLLSDLRAGIVASVEASGLCRIAGPGESATHRRGPSATPLWGGVHALGLQGDPVRLCNQRHPGLPAGGATIHGARAQKGPAARPIHLDAQAICDPSWMELRWVRGV